MSDGIPYTALGLLRPARGRRELQAELSADYLVGIDGSLAGSEDWLLRAVFDWSATDEDFEDRREAEFVASVERHGGRYDGGETGWFSLSAGEFVRGSGN